MLIQQSRPDNLGNLGRPKTRLAIRFAYVPAVPNRFRFFDGLQQPADTPLHEWECCAGRGWIVAVTGAVRPPFDEQLKQLLLGFYATVVGDMDYLNQFMNGRRSMTAPVGMIADAEEAITKAVAAAQELRASPNNPCVSTLFVWSFVCQRPVMVILGGSGNAVQFQKWVEEDLEGPATETSLKRVLIVSDTKRPIFVPYNQKIVEVEPLPYFVVICSPKTNLVRKWLQLNNPDLDCIFDYTGDQVYKAYRSYWDIKDGERSLFIQQRAPFLAAYDRAHGTDVLGRYTTSMTAPSDSIVLPKVETRVAEAGAEQGGRMPAAESGGRLSRVKTAPAELGMIPGW